MDEGYFSDKDLLRENAHSFVDASLLGLRLKCKCCILCGVVRRIDGNNKPCKGAAKVSLRRGLSSADIPREQQYVDPAG